MANSCTEALGIGSEMFYSDSKGRASVGIIVNIKTARLLDTATDEVYLGRKFYVWNEKTQRGSWTCAMRPTAPETTRKP